MKPGNPGNANRKVPIPVETDHKSLKDRRGKWITKPLHWIREEVFYCEGGKR
jgi:hypothetical protein